MADDQIVTSIVAKADLSSLVSEVHRATASLQKLQQDLQSAGKTVSSQVKVINNSFGETLRSTGQFATHFVTLHSDVEKFGKGLDSGRLKLRDYYQAFNQHAKTSGGLIRDLAKQQVMLQNAVMQPIGRNAQGLMQYNVHIPRGLDLVKNKTNLARMELQIMNRAINEGATALINWGKNTQWAGRQLTVGLTVPISAFGAAAAKAFREADQELTRLAKVYGDIGGATADELTRVRQDITSLSKELATGLGVNFKDTISLAADIAATGKTGAELMGSVRETTRLAVLGEVDRQEAMRATLAIQTAFKQNTEELTNSINFLNAVENQTSTSLNDLVEAIPKAGPVVKQLGGDIKDLALYITAMREGGINASESANALKSGLASLINPTKQTVGVMSDFGIDILGMVQKNAGNTTSLLLDLQSALDQLDPLAKAQAIEQMFGKFQFARISALLSNLGREGSQTQQVLQLMGASVADLEQVAGRELAAVTESASGQYRRAIEGLKAELSTLGEDFLGLGTKFINVVTKLMKFLNNLPEPVKKLITAFGGLTAVAGPLIMLTGVLANFAGYILKGATNLKALFSGSKGWKMLTPEIVAADYAARSIQDTFYSDAQAAKVLEQALRNLVDEFNVLSNAANSGKISVKPAISTMSSNLIMPGAAGREVDPSHRLAGDIDTRAFSHINPRKSGYAGNLFGVVPGAIPVNRKIGASPQIYMTERLPNIEGLTSVGGVSTGIVAQEAAKFHALMATLGMQTEAEVAELKKVIALGGTISSDLLNTYDDLLPITAKFANKAAAESALIVAELRAAKITVDEAKLRIMTLNSQIEAEMSAEVAAFAGSRGRTIDFTKAPLMNQPVTDAMGHYTLRDLFKRESNKQVMEEFGRLRGIKTFGAPYSMEVTRLPKLNKGGYASPNIVPGPNINADVVPAMLTPGEFVVNRNATKRNLPLLMAINNGSLGGQVSSNQLGYGNPASQNMFRSSVSDVDMLYSYIDNLMDEGYDNRFRSSAVLNDAMALMQAKVTNNPERAISLAQGYFDQAMELVNQEGVSYRDARDAILRENPRLVSLRRARQGVLPDNIRRQIGDLMRSGNYSLGRNAEFLQRGHLDPIGTLRNTSVGYFGQAVADPYNQFTRNLSTRLPEIEDRIPDNSAAARARASAIINTLGFNDYDDFLMKRSQVENIVASGRVPRGMPVPLGLFRFLRPVNRNMGGIIPGYNRGGGVAKSGRLFYGDNTPAYLSPAWMAARSASGDNSITSRGPGVFSAFREGFTNQRPLIGTKSGPSDPYMKMNAITMGGSMLGMGAMSMGQSGLGMGIMAISGFLPMMLPKLTQLKTSLMAATQGTRGLTAGFKLLGAASRIAWPIAAIAAVGFAIKKVVDIVKENQREQTLLNGMTEEGAKQAGIKYNNLAASIKAVNEQLAAQRALGRANFNAMAPGNIPGISMTIKDMKEAKKFAKENLTEFVSTFNTVSKDQVVPLAQNIKAQFIAGGMSAEEATKKIYGIVAASEKANQVVNVLGSAGFTLIYDKASAADFMVKNLLKNLTEYTRSKDLGNAFSNTLGVIDGIRKGLEGSKDEAGNIITETEALKQTLEQIENINGSDKQIGFAKLQQLKDSQPELAAILNSTDTIASAYAKWQVAISGARVNIQKMTAEQAIMLAKFDAAMTTAMSNMSEAAGKGTTFGAVGSKIKELDKIAKSTSAAAQKASQKTQEQYKKELELLDEKIKKINEEADAKRKALQRSEDKESYQLELQKLQLEYQDSLARGDMAAAARSQLSIQQLQKEKQTTDAINAIEDQRERRLKKAQEEKERIQKAMDAKQTSFQNQQSNAQEAAKVRDELMKQQAEYEKLVKEVANAQAMPANTLKENTRRTNAIERAVGNLGNFTNIVRGLSTSGSAMQQKAFAEAFADILKSPAAVRGTSGSVINGKYVAGPNMPDLGFAAKDVKAAEREALLITGGKKLSDLYDAISKQNNPDKGNIYGKNNPYVLRGKYETKEDGTLTDAARGQIVDRLKLGKNDFFKYGDQLYRVTGSNMNTARAYLQKASGGFISGPGTSTSDSIPAMLSNGEYVINAASVRALGTPLLDRINGMAMGGMVRYDIPKYSTGGRIMYNQGGPASSSNALYNINVTLNGSNMNADDVAKAISREMRIREAAAGIGRRY